RPGGRRRWVLRRGAPRARLRRGRPRTHLDAWRCQPRIPRRQDTSPPRRPGGLTVATQQAEGARLMAGNWKMSLDHREAVHLGQKLAWILQDKKHDFDAVEVVVLPSFTNIRSVQTLIDGDRLRIRHGAQDLSPHDKGAYTGDVSGAMLAKLGCSYVVVG